MNLGWYTYKNLGIFYDYTDISVEVMLKEIKLMTVLTNHNNGMIKPWSGEEGYTAEYLRLN